MLNYQTNEGFYAGVTADCKLIPTAEFQRSITNYYRREGVAFTPPAYWKTARAFDAAPPPQSARATRCHRALDRLLDKLEQRRPARDCKREPRRDDWGRVPAEDSTLPLRDHAEQTFLAGQREMGVREPYGERAFAYRPGRAADGGQDDWAWILGGAGGAASCTGGIL